MKKVQFAFVLAIMMFAGFSNLPLHAAGLHPIPVPKHFVRPQSDNSDLLVNNRPNGYTFIIPVLRIYDAATNSLLASYYPGNLGNGQSESFTMPDYTNVYVLFNTLGTPLLGTETGTIVCNGVTINGTANINNNTMYFGNVGSGFNITGQATVTIN